MLESQCIEWTVLLSVLLLDSSLVAKVVDSLQKLSDGIDHSVVARVMQGSEELYTWAEAEW